MADIKVRTGPVVREGERPAPIEIRSIIHRVGPGVRSGGSQSVDEASLKLYLQRMIIRCRIVAVHGHARSLKGRTHWNHDGRVGIARESEERVCEYSCNQTSSGSAGICGRQGLAAAERLLQGNVELIDAG